MGFRDSAALELDLEIFAKLARWLPHSGVDAIERVLKAFWEE